MYGLNIVKRLTKKPQLLERPAVVAEASGSLEERGESVADGRYPDARAAGDDILGSTAIFGAADTVILLKRRDQGRVLRTIQRYGVDMPETVVALDVETGELSVAGEVADILLRQAAEAVIAAVGDEPLAEAVIRERVGGNATLVRKAIRHLVEAGTFARTGAGKRGDPYRYGPR